MELRRRPFALAVASATVLAACAVLHAADDKFPPRVPFKTDVAKLPLVSAKAQRPGSYFVGSRADSKAIGGYGNCANYPLKIDEKTPGEKSALSLVALPAEPLQYFHSQGFRLLLVNRTRGEKAFQACDSQLDLVCEALDEHRQWKPIETSPPVICGNSYHRVFLPRGHYWEMAAPKFTGDFKTKLRFHLREGDLYSAEFDGAISRAQFRPASPKRG